MAIKNKKGEWCCMYCKKVYVHPQDADACVTEHGVIFCPLTKEDIGRIIQFIYLKDDELIDKELIDRLKGFIKMKVN